MLVFIDGYNIFLLEADIITWFTIAFMGFSYTDSNIISWGVLLYCESLLFK
jgi:hypothetical protein